MRSLIYYFIIFVAFMLTHRFKSARYRLLSGRYRIFLAKWREYVSLEFMFSLSHILSHSIILFYIHLVFNNYSWHRQLLAIPFAYCLHALYMVFKQRRRADRSLLCQFVCQQTLVNTNVYVIYENVNETRMFS